MQEKIVDVFSEHSVNTLGLILHLTVQWTGTKKLTVFYQTSIN